MAKLLIESVNDFSGGTNLRDGPLGLVENELIFSQNVEPYGIGRSLAGRRGQSGYGGSTTAIDTNAIKSLFRWYKQNGTGYLVGSSGTQLWLGTDSDGSFASIATGLATGLRFTGAGWTTKDLLYLTNGTDTVRTFDGTSIAVLGGSPPSYPRIAFHLDRLCLANDTEVRFTNLNVDNVWPAANAINISDPKGSRTRFLVSYNGMLLIGKEAGIFRFRGSPVLGGDLAMFTEVGCDAGYATAVTEQGVIYKSPGGLYITDGFKSSPISPGLEPLFLGNQMTTAVGAWYPRRSQYWFSYPSTTTNDRLWVGTLINVPGQERRFAWHEYTGFKADSFAVWNGGGDDGELYYGRSDNGLVRRADNTNQDMGSNYTSIIQGKHHAHESVITSKLPRWLFLAAEHQAGGNVILASVVDFQPNPSQAVSISGGGSALRWASPDDASNAAFHWGTNVWAASRAQLPEKVSLIGDRTHGVYNGIKISNVGGGSNFRLYYYALAVLARENVRHTRKFTP